MTEKLEAGIILESTYFGAYKILGINWRSQYTIEFLNSGYTCDVEEYRIRRGYVIDFYTNSKRMVVGTVWEDENGNCYKVTRNVYDQDVVQIEWIASGDRYYVATSKLGIENIQRFYLPYNPVFEFPMGHYVYIAKVDSKIVYIGKGTAGRYRHCNSGKSSSIGLNKLFFEGKDIVVEIAKEDLSDFDARRLEAALILEHKPFCNSRQPCLH